VSTSCRSDVPHNGLCALARAVKIVHIPEATDVACDVKLIDHPFAMWEIA
jgi:hypothetical protein